jgi:hypothetical protein
MAKAAISLGVNTSCIKKITTAKNTRLRTAHTNGFPDLYLLQIISAKWKLLFMSMLGFF